MFHAVGVNFRPGGFLAQRQLLAGFRMKVFTKPDKFIFRRDTRQPKSSAPLPNHWPGRVALWYSSRPLKDVPGNTVSHRSDCIALLLPTFVLM